MPNPSVSERVQLLPAFFFACGTALSNRWLQQCAAASATPSGRIERLTSRMRPAVPGDACPISIRSPANVFPPRLDLGARHQRQAATPKPPPGAS
jgi:hypothetical protein